MRVMVIVQATRNSEAGVLPGEETFAAMGRFNEELVTAGIMQAGEGLHPSSSGKRVRFSGGRTTVIDGPFTPPGGLVAGFWIWKVQSMEEAVAWARRCPDPMPGEEATLEIRRIYEAEDFGEALTPELRAQEDRLRAATEKANRS